MNPVKPVAHSDSKFQVAALFPKKVIDFYGDRHAMNVLLAERQQGMNAKAIPKPDTISEAAVSDKTPIITYAGQLGGSKNLC